MTRRCDRVRRPAFRERPGRTYTKLWLEGQPPDSDMNDLTARFREQDALFEKMFERFQQGHAHVKASLVSARLLCPVRPPRLTFAGRSPTCAKTEPRTKGRPRAARSMAIEEIPHARFTIEDEEEDTPAPPESASLLDTPVVTCCCLTFRRRAVFGW